MSDGGGDSCWVLEMLAYVVKIEDHHLRQWKAIVEGRWCCGGFGEECGCVFGERGLAIATGHDC